MKKAVIATGGKQYIVSEGDLLDIELIQDEKVTEFDVMLLIDGDTDGVEVSDWDTDIVIKEIEKVSNE